MNNRLINLIDRHDIISFDIFDTLIKRNVRYPQDIFSVVEKEFNATSTNAITDFKTQRIEAEKKARCLSAKEDITIEEIYQLLSYEEKVRKILMNLEINCEKKFLTTNIAIKEVFNYAISKKKTIILVSDMYLPYTFFVDILSTLGYTGYYKLYVSSSIGLTKASGRLFQFILKENNWEPSKILHIGDAKKADWIRPRLLGIHSYKIPNYVNNMLYSNKDISNDLNYNILSSFINNTVLSYTENRYKQIGYETLGPFIYGFCVWLHEYKIKFNLKRILFLSRDGYIIYSAYKKLFPKDECKYIYVSRRSLTVPLIHKQKNLKEVFDLIPTNRFTQIQIILDRLGIDYKQYESLIKDCGLKKDTSFTKEEFLKDSRFLKLYSLLEKQIKENSFNEYKSLESYIKQLNLQEKEGIVDLGWNGTIQNSFEKIIKDLNLKTTMYSFYVGIKLNRENTFGYIFSPKDNTLRVPILGFLGLVETLFSANHGSVKRYINTSEVEFYDFEYTQNNFAIENYKIIKEIQNGALDFVRNMHQSKISDSIKWNQNIAFNNIQNLGIYPHNKELQCFGDFYYFDHQIYYLARPSLTTNLTKELSSSTWKIGFLKRLLRLPLPYLKIYTFIWNKTHHE